MQVEGFVKNQRRFYALFLLVPILTCITGWFIFSFVSPKPGLTQGAQSALQPVVFAAQLSYPLSPVIENVTWDFQDVARAAEGSDLFPLTWAADDNLYTVWGDGWGFTSRARFKLTKKYLGISRISGGPTGYASEDLWSGKGKSHGIISVDGALHMIVTEEGNGWSRAKLGRSTDYGVSWTFKGRSFDEASWDFQEPGGVFAGACFLQFGKDYQGARDGFVYGYSEKVRNVIQPDIVMFRVHKNRILERSAYEFFAGLDANRRPQWTKNIKEIRPVFSDPNGVSWGMQAVYHPILKRYLLTVRRDDSSSAWGIFDAPEPWGPWTTVAYYDSWLDSQHKLTFSFNQKWMSPDGQHLWMVFSGLGIYDSFNVVKATLTFR
jgi:hypothetical protein